MVDGTVEHAVHTTQFRAIQYLLAAIVLAVLAVGFGTLPNAELLGFISGFVSLFSLIGSFLTVRRAKLESAEK